MSEIYLPFTGGQWAIARNVLSEGDAFIVTDEVDDAVIASVGMDMPDAEANARLLAAAKDLYEQLALVLSRAAEMAMTICDDFDHGPTCNCEGDKANAVLKRVLGQRPQESTGTN